MLPAPVVSTWKDYVENCRYYNTVKTTSVSVVAPGIWTAIFPLKLASKMD